MLSHHEAFAETALRLVLRRAETSKFHGHERITTVQPLGRSILGEIPIILEDSLAGME